MKIEPPHSTTALGVAYKAGYFMLSWNSLYFILRESLWFMASRSFAVLRQRVLRECPPQSGLSERSELKRRADISIRKTSSKTNMSCGHNHRRHAYEKAVVSYEQEITALGNFFFIVLQPRMLLSVTVPDSSLAVLRPDRS